MPSIDISSLRDLNDSRKERIRAKNIQEKDYLTIRKVRRQDGSKGPQVNITLRAGVMNRSGLTAGDRLRIYTDPDQPRVIGVGYPAQGSRIGWKLCPYNHHSEGYETYEEAMGTQASSTFHFTLSEVDVFPELPFDETIEIQLSEITFAQDEDELVRLAFSV